MRAGGLLVIALAVAALLHSRRKPIEDAGEQSHDGDQFPHVLCGAGGFLLSPPSADLPGRCVTAAPVLHPEVEDDGFFTVIPRFHGATK